MTTQRLVPAGPDDLARTVSTEAASGRPERRPAPRWARRGATVVGDLAALVVVLAALLLPDHPGRLSPGAFVGLPWEAVAGAALVLLLPRRTGRRLATAGGLVLGLLLLGKVLDLGFFTALSRPFDPVLDGVLLRDAVGLLAATLGRAQALAVAVAVCAAALAAVVLVTASARRLATATTRRAARANALVAVLAVGWVTLSGLGTTAPSGDPVATDGTAPLAVERVRQLVTGLRDRSAFEREARVDAFAATPGDRLLTGLRGHTVVLAFVESYGRSALEDQRFSAPVVHSVDDGTARLAAAGFSARSAFLTSPTSGGDSWLAHSTLQSGLWIDNEQRYRDLVAGQRLTLSGAFHRAGWRTVGVMPGVTRAWPEGRFYGFDRIYDSRDVGYRGPHFSWAPMPDQYVLSAFQRSELSAATGRGPVMAEIPLVSSHAPWAPLPEELPWEDVGDGSVYDPQPARGAHPSAVWADPTRIRAAYADSVAYTLDTLVSFLATYGTDDTVLVFLGDHQPAAVVTGEGASRDVPVTVVARDPAVLDRIADWGWQPGLHPSPSAPVWRMDTFRDRFLTTFSS